MLEIMVVEDNHALREEWLHYLERPGWCVKAVADGVALNSAMVLYVPDILILDLNLPGEDGLSIAKRVREHYPRVGIVMVTARAGLSDRALGYGQGADVYLSKPASVGEIESVIDNLSKRLDRQMQANSVDDSLQLDRRTLNLNLICDMNRSAHLSASEFKVMHYLALCHDQCATRSELVDFMSEHDSRHSDDRKLTLLMARLRTKIHNEIGLDDALITLHGFGYRLTYACCINDSTL